MVIAGTPATTTGAAPVSSSRRFDSGVLVGVGGGREKGTLSSKATSAAAVDPADPVDPAAAAPAGGFVAAISATATGPEPVLPSSLLESSGLFDVECGEEEATSRSTETTVAAAEPAAVPTAAFIAAVSVKSTGSAPVCLSLGFDSDGGGRVNKRPEDAER